VPVTFLRESYIVFRRQMRMNLRNPAWVIIGMLQPVLYLFLFGPLLKPLADQFGADNAYTFFVPGLLCSWASSARSSPGSASSRSGGTGSSRRSASPRRAGPHCWSGG
jgi:hypothetical protein